MLAMEMFRWPQSSPAPDRRQVSRETPYYVNPREEKSKDGKRMKSQIRITLIAAIVLFAQLDEVACFWFADSSLFQPNTDQPLELTTPTTAAQTIPPITTLSRGADNQKHQQQVSFSVYLAPRAAFCRAETRKL